MSVKVDTDAVKALAERFGKMGPEGRDKVVAAVQKQAFMLVGYIKLNKLQGQVLHHRSGNLSSRVTAKTEVHGNKIESRVGVFAGVNYARIHEYGGRIKRTKKDGSDYYIEMPERSYLRSSLAENYEKIAAAILKALKP